MRNRATVLLSNIIRDHATCFYAKTNEPHKCHRRDFHLKSAITQGLHLVLGSFTVSLNIRAHRSKELLIEYLHRFCVIDCVERIAVRCLL